jgi:hypothetical protein
MLNAASLYSFPGMSLAKKSMDISLKQSGNANRETDGDQAGFQHTARRLSGPHASI